LERERLEVVDDGGDGLGLVWEAVPLARAELVVGIQGIGGDIDGQQRHQRATIPVVCDTATIVDLARQEGDHLERHIGILVQEDFEL
jgi:hypothetical protein